MTSLDDGVDQTSRDEPMLMIGDVWQGAHLPPAEGRSRRRDELDRFRDDAAARHRMGGDRPRDGESAGGFPTQKDAVYRADLMRMDPALTKK
jgi:hypothetical protein